MTKKEYDYLYKKAVAWETECIAVKRCLFDIAMEAARIDTKQRSDEIDFWEIKEILNKHGFGGFYTEALKKIEVSDKALEGPGGGR